MRTLENQHQNSRKSKKRKKPSKAMTSTASTSKSGRWNVPNGSTIDLHGNLIIPGPSTSRNLSKTSTEASMISINSRCSEQISKPQKIKPIIVDINFKTINNQLDVLKLSPKPLLKILRNSDDNPQTKIECSSLESKEKIIKMLQEKSFAFHTHSDSGKRTKLFVLKNYFKTECSEILSNLQQANLQISKVSILFDHPQRPIYLIHSNDENLSVQDLQRNHKSIDSIIVTWEKFDLRRKKPMPCRRCKMWGHSASNCYRQYRCIKCDQSHEPGQCSRTDKTIGFPKCVNCGGDHPANSTSCPSYIKYLKNIQNRRPPQRFVNQTPLRNQQNSQKQPIFQNSNIHLPDSYAATVSRSLNDNCSNNFQRSKPQSNLFDLFSEFNSIKNIEITLQRFADLICRLKATENERDRSLILINYCMINTLRNNDP